MCEASIRSRPFPGRIAAATMSSPETRSGRSLLVAPRVFWRLDAPATFPRYRRTGFRKPSDDHTARRRRGRLAPEQDQADAELRLRNALQHDRAVQRVELRRLIDTRRRDHVERLRTRRR